MGTPEKSSDEILKELFGLCQPKQCQESDKSSQDENSSSESDSKKDVTSKKHKKKKKKKKHKKGKKRHRSASSSSNHITDDKISHKHKKKKSHKEKYENTKNDITFRKKEIKLKPKLEEPLSDTKYERLDIAYTLNNNKINKNKNFMDTVTGEALSIDDVFNTLGIITENSVQTEILKGKNECNDNLKENVDQKIQENQAKNDLSANLQNEEIVNETTESDELNSKHKEIECSNQKKNAVSEVFIVDADCKPNSGAKKISIKNLKNSTVYEATIKEIEERERLKAEKYEEGELSSNSSSSDFGTDSQNELLNRDKDYSSHELKKRSRSKCFESKHRSHHRRPKHRRKSSHHDHRSHKRYRSSNRRRHRSKDSSVDYHYRHHHKHRHHSRDSSKDSRSSSVTHRCHKSRSRKRERSFDDKKSRSKSKSKSKERKSRSVEKIDKQKLLEIARKNAINLLKQGSMPASVIANKDKIAFIKAGGKTVDELTDFCKQLSKKDAEGENSSHSESDIDSGDDKGVPFHHPFQLKERPSSIVMNIRNAVSLPTKTAQEKTLQLSKQLSLQYPVSSGQQHRKNESEWIPVVRSEENVTSQSSAVAVAVVVPPPESASTNVNLYYHPNSISTDINYGTINSSNIVPNPIFPQNTVDIGSIVAQRLEAIRRLTENPQDPVGNNLIQAADSKIRVWAESKVQPGLFTGNTGVKPLSAAELASGYKAWAKKNQFNVAKPVYSDKGEALMKKMGWQPGEGLGKYKQGPSAPCEINMKTDRKGLAEQIQGKIFKQNNSLKKAFEICQNKHPVSLLNEFCSRRKIGVPEYDCEEKEGVGRRKLFLFSVIVQGNRYTPKMPSTNKKQSKIESATVCLQSLGLLPIVPPTSSE